MCVTRCNFFMGLPAGGGGGVLRGPNFGSLYVYACALAGFSQKNNFASGYNIHVFYTYWRVVES
jgi:hypothetical protein